jgi:hypothetical protein
MKKILAAILLATIATAANAEPRTRQIRFMCGSFEEVEMTMEKYGEKLVLATIAPNKETINMLWANFETQTSSWFVHDLKTNEYCMMGVGDEMLIPKESPLNSELGTKTLYK